MKQMKQIKDIDHIDLEYLNALDKLMQVSNEFMKINRDQNENTYAKPMKYIKRLKSSNY